MPIVLNGSGTVTGISAGGLPDGIIQAADLASGVGGKILQVVSVSDSVRESVGTVSLSSANTYYDTPFAVTITPSATSSKILLMGHVMGEFMLMIM